MTSPKARRRWKDRVISTRRATANRARCPCGKLPYRSEREASTALGDDGLRGLSVYRCEHGAWHTTSQTKGHHR